LQSAPPPACPEPGTARGGEQPLPGGRGERPDRLQLPFGARPDLCQFPGPQLSLEPRQRAKKSRKAYLYDLSVRNSSLKDFRTAKDRPDRGAIYESFVFLMLKAHLAPSMEIRFWRTKKDEEVDFVLVKDRRPFPIEVKTQLGRPTVPPGIQAFCRR